MSFTSISISISNLIVWITTSSVTSCLLSSMPCIRRQFPLDYCSCLSICCSILPFLFPRKDTRSCKYLICSSFFFLSSSNSSNFFVMQSTELAKSSSCFSPLIWLSLVKFATSYIFTTFVSNSFKQLNKISLQLELLIPSAKTSPASASELPEHSSLNFFGSFPPSLLEFYH